MSQDSHLEKICGIVHRYRPDLASFEAAYHEIHQNADLSTQENYTANYVESFLSNLEFRVISRIGGTGVAGVLSNGDGETVLLRAELDGLPIEEATQVPYASTKRMLDAWGREQPTMHACGHDLHMVCLMASATLLKNAMDQWKGTLVVVFQPNEEHTGGAKAMLDDGLYDCVPIPDVVLAQHSGPFKAGTLNIRGGPVLVSADTVRINLFSTRGFDANPQVNIDPVKLASHIILKLDGLAKEVAGDEYASISVNEIHAGHPGQDWVSHVNLTLDVKTYNPDIRQDLLERIRRGVIEASVGAGVTIPPEITCSVRAPLTNNSHTHAEALRKSFIQFFGECNIGDDIPKHPCEDFSRLATVHGRPYVFWFFGREEPRRYEEAIQQDKFLDKIPLNHSPFNLPQLQPSLQVGADALSLAALRFFLEGEQDFHIDDQKP
ncbi:hypothetical protein F5Y10DRAFT_274708 [Nemania abortiva]|nr:hypothetical protein F5Y10DRAFT_274708 [Nemania abortiva]